MKWFRTRSGKHDSSHPAPSARRTKLGLEALERRLVMDISIGLLASTDFKVFDISNSASTTLEWDPTCEFSIDEDKVVTIEGGMGGDQVTVVDDYTTGLVTIGIQCGDGQSTPWMFPQGEVQKIVFHGWGSNDSFVNHSAIPSEAYGGAGNDVLIGGSAGDDLHGGSGNDHLEGNGASWGMLIGDALYGDEGDDTLIGGGWNDFLSGGSGHDDLSGGGGSDVLLGGSGNDVLAGGTGNDQIFGGSGWDQLFGEAGNDYLEGGKDHLADEMTGGSGSDTFVNEWRTESRNGGWTVSELEQVTDFALGDTLEWKHSQSRMAVPWFIPSLG